jgi:thioesterase domain-containing protein
MARQLVRRGETVNLVAIVDARAWNRRFQLLRVTLDGIGALTGASRARRDERFLALRAQALLLEVRAKRYQQRVVGLSPAARLAALTRASVAVVASVRDALRRGRPVATEASGIPGVASALERYTRAVNAYVPGRYRGRVAVLAAADRPRESGDLGWGRVADDVEVHRIPGDHFTTLTRHTHALGARLRDCVEAVEMP